MIRGNVISIIDRTYAILPMYEEKKRSSVLVDQINSICDDLSGLSYYVDGIDKEYGERVIRCRDSLKNLCSHSTDDGIYEFPHSYVRKVILDVCGDLRRLKDEVVR